MQIFVGSLSFASSKEDVRKLFEQFGKVDSVIILMNKKGKKSRGFGFVEMADEQTCRAAIAGLDGKDFMGRALKVMAARPKPIKEPEPGREEKPRFQSRRFRSEDRQYPPRENFESQTRFKPVPRTPGKFKGGRRSTSYLRRVANKSEEEIQAMKETRRTRPWQKRSGPFKPWQRQESQPKPWQGAEGPAKPWQKSEGRSKPWKKSEGLAKPWKKTEGSAKPWQKSGEKPRLKSSGPAPRSRFKSRAKSRGRF